MDNRVIGILGGGQLGRMIAEAAHRLGINVIPLDPDGKESPAGQVAELALEGSFRDREKIIELAALCDIITTEIEHVNCDVLEELENQGIKVEPASKTIRTIQNKFLQKEYMLQSGIDVGEFMDTLTELDVAKAGNIFGYPFMLKAKMLAYDGRGNVVVRNAGEIPKAWEKLGKKGIYAEKWVPFVKELAIMVVRSSNGEVCAYPLVEAVQQDSICHTTIVPPSVSSTSSKMAESLALKAVSSLWGAGVFGVEMFLLADGRVLFNEVAPRPHNTGHYTYEACECDQFENHLRAIMGLPLGRTGLKVGASMMLNVLGTGDISTTREIMNKSLSIPGAALHWYGKKEARKGRKMGHITFCAENMNQLQQRVMPFGLLQDSDQVNGYAKNKPLVGIIMGSDSDLPTMSEAAEVLEKFDVPYELTIVSAHRTPTRLYSYSQEAVSRGLKVIIAGAGGAAHLPGMCAAITPLPVIGVPIKTSTLNGVDSLHSIVQMPRGIPVATVAIGNATNAALLAVRMLGIADYTCIEKMAEFLKAQELEVLGKVNQLEHEGWKEYLSAKKDRNKTVGV